MPPAPPCSGWTEWGKWLALITMTLDHVARYLLVPAGHGQALWIMETAGRIAFPLFAAMVAWHALYDTSRHWRYTRRLLIIGLVAQLPFMLLTGGLALNVCFTLALGLMLACTTRALMREAAWNPATVLRHVLLAAVGLFLWYAVGPRLEYGRDGVLIIPAFMLAQYLLVNYPRLTAALGCLPVCWLATQLNDSTPALFFTCATTLFVLVIAARGGHDVPRLPPRATLPRWLWRSWYPGHLGIIVALVVVQ
ncbi:TraX family protein [Larsenimonas rhizosphaerae]|uniref:TraX family protein n=1 Tax=Larsenimonas rhizosphaerae TaxID=2944682 RepID=A0AA42CUK8_9GAMM|nr:TraX family protein [Larsenimonas rhizosphaerae]MCX2524091.1 TraX family protein [Larsenimonas rhizosphaerae]